MPQLNSKLPNVGTTIFTTMSKMAADHGAINLSQGFPDFDAPKALIDLVSDYMNRGFNQYPPMTGVESLRHQIALKNQRLYRAEINHDTEVTITSGATEALFVAIQTVVQAGDEVIVFDPAYDSYEPAVTLAGGKTIHLNLQQDANHRFTINWQQVKDAITSKTKLIIINTPHNPSGSVLSEGDLNNLTALAEVHDFYILSDEVYEHMVYDGQVHMSLLRRPDLMQRTFVVSSFGKTYHATGWKIAHCIAPPALTAEFRKIHQYVTFTTHTASQWALADFLAAAPEHYLELPSFYQAKRDLFVNHMKGSRFDLKPSQGTYFQLAEYSQVSDEYSDLDDVGFANYLTQEIGVAVIPISVFYDAPPSQKLVRFCFAKSDDTLIKACAKLSNI